MTKVGAPRHDPVPIGEEAKPPFARLPDLATLFETRAARYRSLAPGHDLEPYLLFLADLADIQHELIAVLPPVTLPSLEARIRAKEYGLPPLDRNRFDPLDPVFVATLDGLLARVARIAMPEVATEALKRVTEADPAGRATLVMAVLADAAEVEKLADHVFVAAALQVHFARLAAALDVAALVPVGDGACPCCGGPPVSSMLVGWTQANNTRFCGCAVCGTLWNYVRIKCTLCGETKGIAYQEIEGGAGTIKAETCDSCRGYVKILHQIKDPHVDPVADDVASLGLDLLMAETDFRRGAVNPFLLGY